MAEQVIVKSNTNSSNAVAITALVTGITGVALSWVPLVGFALGVLGIVFGALGMKRDDAKGMSIAGFVTGCAAVLFGLILAAFFIFAFTIAASQPSTPVNYWNSTY
jgi:hypothetical protein